MINAEVKIFNRAYESIAPLCAKNMFVSQQVVTPSAFPASCLFELDNVTVRNRQSSTPTENFSRITYQLECFAQSKSKCREVYMAGDEAMIAMNFTRISGQFIDNGANTKVFRYVARYEAMIDTEGNLYRI